MEQKEREILNVEESFRDIIENDINEKQTKNKKIEIKDIKLVGQAIWKDKVNGKDISDYVFIVEKQITEIDENGRERITEQKSYYLGDKCIAGTLGNEELIYNGVFANSEPDKVKAINELLGSTPEEEIEKNSMNRLQNKELSEVLTAHFGRKISEEEVQKLLEDMNEQELEELKEEKEEKNNGKEKEEQDKLSQKQTEKIKVNGIQKADLNQKVDGKETLGKRLDLDGYNYIYVVYSEKVKEINPNAKINDTTYSLVGMNDDGRAKVLNDEFEIESSVGNNASKVQTRINADGTATRDSKDSSVFTRKSNGMTVGCRNDSGIVRMSLGQKTLEENEITSTEIRTSKTGYIPIQTREVFNRNKGMYQIDKIQDEVKEHTDNGCNPKEVEDFDGNENTATHIDADYTEIDENDYIPNTNMTWREFANKCGYRGNGTEDIKKAVEVVEKMDVVNDEVLEEHIEEIEEEFEEERRKR